MKPDLRNRKQKILFMITKSNFGGAQKYVFDSALKARDEDGIECVVALGGEGELKTRLKDASFLVRVIPGLGRDFSFLKDLSSFLYIYKILREEKPSVLNLNSSKIGFFGTLAGRIFNLFKKKNNKVKTVFVAHGWAFSEDRNIFSKKTLLFLQWLTVLLSHSTIAVSNATRSEITHLPFIRRKIDVVQNTLTPILFHDREKTRREFSQTYSISNNTKWFVALSELHPNKGLSYAIDACALLRQEIRDKISFVIMGEGEERTRLEERIRKNGLEGTVFCIGYKEGGARYLKGFDAFLFPSIKEGFPYALLEAREANLPIIASDVGGVSEIVTSEKIGFLVPPKSSQYIANIVEKFV